ncbi:MAG: tyrosine-type recombinase/integrase [Solirubrobacteraceae bacterium]
MQRTSGHVFRVERNRGPVWYAKYRLPSGRQVQRMLGPAWGARGRPPAGQFTKRLAEDWLRETLDGARRGTTAGMVETGATFADAAEEYLRFAEQDRGCKPTTIRSYRSAINAHLLPAFGSMRIEDLTARDIERWRSGMSGTRDARALSNKTKNNLLVLMHAIFRRAVKLYGLPINPVANVDRFRVRPSGDIDVFSPEEVWSLARAAASEIDGAIFLTAAFTGLRRGELLALRWRDVDFTAATIRVRASYAGGQLTTPKSGKVRSVPLAPDVATTLARLGQRERFRGEDDFVFAGQAGMPLNGDALSARYERALTAAGLRRLRFHDLRHTFGTRMISEADIRRVQEWMGHADIQTTMKYLHYKSRSDDADLVARAFRTERAEDVVDTERGYEAR